MLIMDCPYLLVPPYRRLSLGTLLSLTFDALDHIVQWEALGDGDGGGVSYLHIYQAHNITMATSYMDTPLSK